MNKEKLLRFHHIYRIVLSISILLAGICFIAGCLSIYLSGEQPYSRETVADTFSYIAVTVYICLILVVVGFILELLLPCENKKTFSHKKRKAHSASSSRITHVSKNASPTEPHDMSGTKRLILLFAGVGILVYGFFTGGTLDVLTKAINICTECIGLG